MKYFNLFFFFFFWFLVIPFVVTVTPRVLTVQEGETAKFMCQMSGTYSATLQWTRSQRVRPFLSLDYLLSYLTIDFNFLKHSVCLSVNLSFHISLIYIMNNVTFFLFMTTTYESCLGSVVSWVVRADKHVWLEIFGYGKKYSSVTNVSNLGCLLLERQTG